MKNSFVVVVFGLALRDCKVGGDESVKVKALCCCKIDKITQSRSASDRVEIEREGEGIVLL